MKQIFKQSVISGGQNRLKLVTGEESYKKIYSISERFVALSTHYVGEYISVKAFVRKVPVACKEIADYTCSVKNSNDIDNFINIAFIDISVHISGENRSAEADIEQVDLVFTCFFFDILNKLVKSVCRIHNIAHKVECVKINFIFTGNLGVFLNREHTVEPCFVVSAVKRVLIKFRKREVEILKLKIVDKRAVGICSLCGEYGINNLLDSVAQSAVPLSYKHHNKRNCNIAKNDRNEVICVHDKERSVDGAAVLIIYNLVVFVAQIYGRVVYSGHDDKRITVCIVICECLCRRFYRIGFNVAFFIGGA